MGIVYSIDVARIWDNDPSRKPSDNKIINAMRSAGKAGVRVAKSNARVDTGNMRDGVDWEMDEYYNLKLRCDVPYAIYNEKGTEFMDSQEFMEPGLHAVLDVLNSRLGGNADYYEERMDDL